MDMEINPTMLALHTQGRALSPPQPHREGPEHCPKTPEWFGQGEAAPELGFGVGVVTQSCLGLYEPDRAQDPIYNPSRIVQGHREK